MAVSLFYQASCFQMMENMLRPMNSMCMSPLLHFICYELSSLIRSNAVWNTMTVDKTFCKSMDDKVGRSILCRERKFISRASVYSNKNKMLPFHDGSSPM
uniref:Uncharacterized protein n=1 Tax=Felis catus TaxID=9685 RepID=A0ABI7XTY7_FELCA